MAPIFLGLGVLAAVLLPATAFAILYGIAYPAGCALKRADDHFKVGRRLKDFQIRRVGGRGAR